MKIDECIDVIKRQKYRVQEFDDISKKADKKKVLDAYEAATKCMSALLSLKTDIKEYIGFQMEHNSSTDLNIALMLIDNYVKEIEGQGDTKR